jgi:large subunit ribosomal protein L18
MSQTAIARREHRLRRHRRVRKSVSGTASRPRLAVFRSTTHIYAQLIDDDAGRTLCASSSLVLSRAGSVGKTEGGAVAGAAKVGEDVARKAAALGIRAVCFDRGGFRYHGRVKALADAARKAGLEF